MALARRSWERLRAGQASNDQSANRMIDRGGAMTDGSAGYGLQAGQGERLEMLGTEQVVLAGASTGASFMVLAADWPADSGPPPHIHDDEDEAFYVLGGRVRVKCGTDEWVLEPGGFAYLPRGVIHQPSVEGPDPARLLVITSRTGLEQYFAEVAAELAASGMPPDLELLDRVGAPYGLRHFPPGTDAPPDAAEILTR